MKRRIIWPLVTIAFIFLIAPIIYFVLRFHKQDISQDISDWASFGSYFGGIIQPIIALLSLIVLTYITYLVSKLSSEENLRTSQLLKKYDAYDEVAKHLTILQSLTDRIISIGAKFTSPEYFGQSLDFPQVSILLDDILKLAHSFSEYDSTIRNFDARYGYLFDYDFDCSDYLNVKETSGKIKAALFYWHENLASGNTIMDKKIAPEIRTHLPFLNSFLNNIREELY